MNSVLKSELSSVVLQGPVLTPRLRRLTMAFGSGASGGVIATVTREGIQWEKLVEVTGQRRVFVALGVHVDVLVE